MCGLCPFPSPSQLTNVDLRCSQVCKQLVKLGHEVHVVTAAPELVFRLDLAPPHQKKLHCRRVRVVNV